MLHVIKNWVVHRITNKSRDTPSNIIENFFFYKNSNQWKLMRMKRDTTTTAVRERVREREREKKISAHYFQFTFNPS